jgi:hypothetical protein
LPSLTAECCAWLTHIHYMNTYMPSMPFISHMLIQGQTIARHYKYGQPSAGKITQQVLSHPKVR